MVIWKTVRHDAGEFLRLAEEDDAGGMAGPSRWN